MLPHPVHVFDRGWEWRELARFATDRREGPTLGLVTGRRRMGKSLLLSALTDAVGGLHHEAVEAARGEALRRLGESVAERAGLASPVGFDSVEAAVEGLLSPAGDAPALVVVDELPYLAAALPELPSVLAAALGPRGRRRRGRVRLLLCGSALSVMGGLLRADAPLRGRAGLELTVSPFDYRDAARFWGLDGDPACALAVFAITGGTPAYRVEFVGGDAPAGSGDLDDWVARAVLNPARPLLREGRVLLAEEPELRDRGLYHSVLAAVAAGHRTRGRIASAVGRPADRLSHPLHVLEEAGLLRRDHDAFRRGRPLYGVADPFLRFWHAVVRTRAGRLRTPGDAAAVWRDAQATFASQVLGPTFEEVCRSFARSADPDEVGAHLAEVGGGVLSDPRGRSRHEVDVVGHALRADGARRVALLGEAKVAETVTTAHLDRLRQARDLAVTAGHDAGDARLALFAGAGASHDVRAAAHAGEVWLLELADLYRERS